MKKPTLISGSKYGKLTIVEYSEANVRWLCLCECGQFTLASANALINNRHKSCGCARRRYSDKELVIRQIYRRYKRGASKRNVSWNLSRAEFDILIFKNCSYCNGIPSSCAKADNSSNYKLHYNGIDRQDNDLGYIADNCVPCCKICNHSKSDLTIVDWQSWLKRVHGFQKL